MKSLYASLIILCGVWIISPAYASDNNTSNDKTMKKYTFNKEFSIKKKQWIELEDGLKIQFLAHSHKAVMAGGPASPLIVAMNYELKGDEYQQRHYVYPDEDNLLAWSWNHYTVHINSHVYGQSMNLTIIKAGP